MSPEDQERLRATVLEAERLERGGDRAGAVEALRRGLMLAPELAPLHAQAGTLLHDLGRADEAASHFAQAAQLKPQEVRYWNNLAAALNALGRSDEARAAAERALERNPGYAWAHFNRARALAALGKKTEAREAFARVVAIEPSLAIAWDSLGQLLLEEGRLVAAREALARAVEHDPSSAGAWARYGAALLHLARHREAIEAMERAESLHPPDDAEMASARLIALHYDPARSLDEIFEAHRDWARRFAPTASPVVFPNARTRDRPLKIGYVSQRFHGESLLHRLFERVIASHDPHAVEVACYSTRAIDDDVSRRLKARVARWVDASRLKDEALAARMRSDAIDIAVDLAGHTAGHRLAMFARRPAPVCATWLDYFDTTGLDTMDYLITDDAHSPPDDAQRFTERALRLPRIRLCYEPLEDAPAVVPPPLARDAGPVFGSFNRLAKLSPATLDAWCAAMKAVPAARLVIKNSSLGFEEERSLVRGWFAERGIDPARLELRGFSPHREMLGEYADVDLVLDTFPYNGGMTTLEALWMGRPVVSLRGESLVARQGAAILGAAGLGDFVADDVDGFAGVVARWVAGPQRLGELSTGLRNRLRASPLLDAEGMARALEAAYRSMWDGFLEARP